MLFENVSDLFRRRLRCRWQLHWQKSFATERIVKERRICWDRHQIRTPARVREVSSSDGAICKSRPTRRKHRDLRRATDAGLRAISQDDRFGFGFRIFPVVIRVEEQHRITQQLSHTKLQHEKTLEIAAYPDMPTFAVLKRRTLYTLLFCGVVEPVTCRFDGVGLSFYKVYVEYHIATFSKQY